MSRQKKDDLNKPTAVESGKPLTPARTDGHTSTVIVADDVPPEAEVKTAAMPAWPDDSTPGTPLTTQPVPAWPTTGEQAVPNTDEQAVLPRTDEQPVLSRTDEQPVLQQTQPTPAWEEAPAKPAAPKSGLSTEPTPAWEEVAEVKTRGVPALKLDAAQETQVKLAQVTNDEVRKAVTRPTQRNAIPKPILLTLAGLTTLALVLLLWLFGRTDTVKDPSRPEKLVGLPAAVKKAPAPLPEKRADVTPLIAAPKEAPRPPLTMDLTLDAGAGLPPEVKKVPASIVRIDTEPPVSVSWNGEDFGWTPALVTMPVGQNVISIENKEVGLKKSMTITASNEERTFLRFEFAKGWLSVDRPKTAKVSVEGVKVTGREILLWEGRHRVDCVFANGQKTSKLADVVRGETAEIFFDDPLPQE